MALREFFTLTPGSLIAPGTAYDCEQGWDPIPCITFDELTMFVPDEETARRGMEAFARLHASFAQVVIGKLQKSANDKAASAASCTGHRETCAWQPCESVDCCEFGAINCPERFVAGEAT